MKVFDLHTDTMMDVARWYGEGERDILAHRHQEHYKKGDIGGMIFALWTPSSVEIMEEFMPHLKEFDPRDIMLRMIARNFREFEDTDVVEVAYNTADMARISAAGKIPVILGLEGFYGLGNEPGMIDVMYRLGFRHGMLTWNDDNEYASGVIFNGEDHGLTPLGAETVRRMEDLGMIIDVSHASQQGFWDIMENTTGPIIASHSNAWSLCPHPRNLKDDQLKALAERDGVVGMNTWWEFIDEDQKVADVNRLAEHARYIADLIGVEHVGCGFDYCNYLQDEDLTPGLESAADTQNFLLALRDQGFTEEEVQAIAWDNAERVIRKVLG